MDISSLVHAICSGSPKQILIKCSIILIIAFIGIKFTLNALRGAFNVVLRVSERLFLFILIAAALFLGAQHLAEGKAWPFKGQPYVPRLAKDLLPSNWKLVKWYESDLDGDSISEYLIIFKFDQPMQQKKEETEVANPLGAVVLDREKNLRPESFGKEIPYSPGSYITYRLLPDLYPGGGLGSIGRSKAQPVLYTLAHPPEIGVFGYDYSPWITTFSLYQWDKNKYRAIGKWEGDEGVSVYPDNAKAIPKAKNNELPTIGNTFVNRIVVHKKLPGRSSLCEETSFSREKPGSSFEEDKSMITLCHEKPGKNFHPFYPEETVTAFYQALAEGNREAAQAYVFSQNAGNITGGVKTPCDANVFKTLDDKLKPYVPNPDSAKIRLVRLEYEGVLTCNDMSTPAPLTPQPEITKRLRRAHPAIQSPTQTPTPPCKTKTEPVVVETSVKVAVVVNDSVKYYATWLLKQFPEGTDNPSLPPKWVLCGVDINKIEKVTYAPQKTR